MIVFISGLWSLMSCKFILSCFGIIFFFGILNLFYRATGTTH